ncbi:hypothetical protein [Dapis sp. BLCC M229]|uniref:hypothetical protein n=1 Tax=Dapis sp. BLCC M229 TaxID=3400188 RepID=UPI003CFA8CB7
MTYNLQPYSMGMSTRYHIKFGSIRYYQMVQKGFVGRMSVFWVSHTNPIYQRVSRRNYITPKLENLISLIIILMDFP